MIIRICFPGLVYLITKTTCHMRIRYLYHLLFYQNFQLFKLNGSKLDLRLHRAPLNQFIATRMLFFIYHPSFVSSWFKTPLTNVSDECPDLLNYDSVFHLKECCQFSPNPAYGHLNRPFVFDKRFQGAKYDVLSWLKETKAVPICYFDQIESINRFNLIVSNIFMMAQSLFFLRHFRGTAFGKIIRSVVRCICVFVNWSVIALFVWFPYALLQHNLLFPNRIINDLDSNFEKIDGEWVQNDKSEYSFSSLNMKPLMFRAFFNTFQTTFYQNLDQVYHDPTSCSDALSHSGKKADPCPDYVSFYNFYESKLIIERCIGILLGRLYDCLCGHYYKYTDCIIWRDTGLGANRRFRNGGPPDTSH